MKKLIEILSILIILSLSFSACGNKNGNESYADHEETVLVPTGTYKGLLDKVNEQQRQIDFQTSDNRMLNLYFTDSTRIIKDDRPVNFSGLKKGQTLEVSLERMENYLEPKLIKIVER